MKAIRRIVTFEACIGHATRRTARRRPGRNKYVDVHGLRQRQQKLLIQSSEYSDGKLISLTGSSTINDRLQSRMPRVSLSSYTFDRPQYRHHQRKQQQIRYLSIPSSLSSSSSSSYPGTKLTDPMNARNGDHCLDTELWKKRVESLLMDNDDEETYRKSSNARKNVKNNNPPATNALEELQELLDEMLQITLSRYMSRRKQSTGSYESATEDNVNDNDNDKSQSSSTTTTWNILNTFRTNTFASSYPSDKLISSSISTDDGRRYGSEVTSNRTEPTVLSTLAFGLLDRLVELESTSHLLSDHPLSLSDSNYLNPVLDLWRDELVNLSTPNYQATKHLHVTLSPKDVVSKLHQYRQQSNVLIPDTVSYNIVLDANAERLSQNTTSSTKNSKKKTTDDSDEDFQSSAEEFATDLWRWLIEVSKNDPLIRPDTITLKSIFKVFSRSERPDAPQYCEEMVQEWMDWQGESPSSPSSSRTYCKLLESLVHVWANYNPEIAERYIHQVTSRFLTITTDTPLSECCDPPDTVTWNKLISSFALIHDDPVMSQQILEDFWDFYHRVHDDEMVHPYAWKVRRPDLWSYAPILEGFARQNNALEANKVFARLLKVKTTSPNIQCYTSVMKANEDDPVSVHNLAHQCLDEYQKQQQDPKTNDTQKIVIDNAFFTAWLNACAKARQTEVAKKIMSKHMKSIAGLQPQTTTYLSFLKVFLSNDDSQGAIEWLLGYAKMEKMTEATIVAWTFALIDWYSERDKTSLKRFDDNIDLNIMLQLLVENKLITSSTSFERFLMRLPSKASLQLLSCILASNQGEIDTISTLKMYAIVMHSLAHVKDGAPIIEDLFDDCLSMIATLHETGEELERVRSELYASVLVSWAKQGNFDRIMYWMDRMRDDYGLGVPPLSLPAQTAVVNAFCRAGRVVEAEKIVLSMKKAYEEGTPYVSPPDTFLYNMILRGWMMQKNGHQAYAFLDQHTPNADYISYNYVINALCMEDNLDAAEDLSSRLVDRFRSSPQASLRPNDLTFTPILAGWRRNGDRPDAAKRAEKILQRMINLYGQGVMLRGPDIKSFQVVMDTWDKSSDPNASKHAHKLLVTAPKDIRHSKKLWARLRKLQDNRRLGKGKHRNLSSEESA